MSNDKAFIRGRLAEYNLSQIWLRNELEEVGINTVKTILNDTIKGNRQGDRADKILAASVEILKDYEQFFKNRNKNICDNCTNI